MQSAVWKLGVPLLPRQSFQQATLRRCLVLPPLRRDANVPRRSGPSGCRKSLTISLANAAAIGRGASSVDGGA